MQAIFFTPLQVADVLVPKEQWASLRDPDYSPQDQPLIVEQPCDKPHTVKSVLELIGQH